MAEEDRRVADVAARALKKADAVEAEIRALRESDAVFRSGVAQFQHDIREDLQNIRTDFRGYTGKVEEGVSLIRGMVERSQDDFAQRMNTMDSRVNDRVGNSAKVITESATMMVSNVKDALAIPIKANADALASFMTLSAEITKGNNQRFSSLDNRIGGFDRLTIRVGGWAIVTLLAAFIGLFTKTVLHWW